MQTTVKGFLLATKLTQNPCKAFFFSLESKGLDELLYTREFAERYQLLHKDLNQKFQKQIEALAAYNEVHNLRISSRL